MTTVGCGDKTPKTQAGRTIAIVWMFSAVIIVSGFTATIASTLTVNSLAAEIKQLEDLRAVEQTGTVNATSSEDFLVPHDLLPAHKYEMPRGSNLHRSLNPLLVQRINRADWQAVLRTYNLDTTN